MPAPAPQRSGPAGSIAPASFFEWLYSVFPPDRYRIDQVERGLTLVQGPNPIFQNIVLIDIPFFVTEVRASGIVTATGLVAVPEWALDVQQAGESWCGGPRHQRAFVGAGLQRFPFEHPREVAANSQLTAIINNGLVAGLPAITVDISFVGLEPRMRSKPIRRDEAGGAIL